MGLGIALWQHFGDDVAAIAAMFCLAIWLFGIFFGKQYRLSAVAKGVSITLLVGFAAIALKSALVAENAGTIGVPTAIEDWSGANCSPDVCIFDNQRENKRWSVLATRSRYHVLSMEMAAACNRVDIAISDRWLPWSCKPRWIKADRDMLEQSGGLAFCFANSHIYTVNAHNAHQLWVKAAKAAKA